MGSPKLNKLTNSLLKDKRSGLRIALRTVLDLALIIAVFFAGHYFGNSVLGLCPSLDVVEACYQYGYQVVLP